MFDLAFFYIIFTIMIYFHSKHFLIPRMILEIRSDKFHLCFRLKIRILLIFKHLKTFFLIDLIHILRMI